MPSYEKNKSSGLWSCRFRETDDNGVTHQKRLSGFTTKREAQFGYEDYLANAKALQNAKKADQQIKDAEPDEMFFDDLIAQYLAFTKKRVKESSFYDIESKVRNRLAPYFSGKRMGEITPKMVSDWIENIEYAYSSKKWIMSTLASIYKYGEKYFDIKNIMPKVDRPRNLEPKKEMQIWTPEEFKSFIDTVDDKVYSAFFTTLYITGCRRGECAALTWEDINFRENTIRINKSVSNKTKQSAYLITTPKNQNSVRTVSIPHILADQLAALKNNATEREYVFGGSRPLATSSADYAFRTAIEKAGVKKIRIHDLRHSCASLLISRGVSIVAVSRRLGHINTQQTLNTYSHLMPDDQTVILNVFNDIKI
jgi:integrase